MYDSVEDHYCYKGTTVLKNRRDLRTQEALDRFELAITAQRATEALPLGKLNELHYKRIHWHLFRDVYTWAGEYRDARISKGDSTFCYPEYIPAEMKRLFAGLQRDNNLTGLTDAMFAAKAATLLANLNAIHAFQRRQWQEPNGVHEFIGHPSRPSIAPDQDCAEAFFDGHNQGFSGRRKAIGR